MKEDIQISVIIPIYNADRFLEKCLNSVLRQRNISFEVICVDDASSDGSVDMVKRYAASDERIVLIESDKNRGQAYARNMGMNVAKGEYIYFMDSDDWLSTDEAFEGIYKAVDNDGIDLLVFNAGCEYEIAKEVQCNDMLHFKGLREDIIYNGQEFVCECLKNHSFRSAVWQQFWNRKFLLEKSLCFDERTHPYEDALFTFQGMLQCIRVKYIEKEYYTYLWRETSSSHVKYHMQYLRAACICYCESLKFLQNYPITSEVSKYVGGYLNMYKRLINKNLINIVNLKIAIQNIDGLSEFEKIILQQIMNERFSYVRSALTYEQYKQLSMAGKVIIYGLGGVGKDVYVMLRNYGINNVLLAVTKIKDSFGEYEGNKIWELSELLHCRNSSIVVIAVGSKLKNDMINYAIELGFEKIMQLDICI